MQGKVALVRPLHPTPHVGQYGAVAQQVRDQRQQRRVHQRLCEHRVIVEDRVHPITEGRIDQAGVVRCDGWSLVLQLAPAEPVVLGAEEHVRLIGVGFASLHIGPLAVALLGDVEQGGEHPVGHAVRVRKLGRDHSETVGVQVCDVRFHAEFAYVVPRALMGIRRVCYCWYCCHDSFPPRIYLSDSTPSLRIAPSSPRCPIAPGCNRRHTDVPRIRLKPLSGSRRVRL